MTGTMYFIDHRGMMIMMIKIISFQIWAVGTVRQFIFENDPVPWKACDTDDDGGGGCWRHGAGRSEGTWLPDQPLAFLPSLYLNYCSAVSGNEWVPLTMHKWEGWWRGSLENTDTVDLQIKKISILVCQKKVIQVINNTQSNIVKTIVLFSLQWQKKRWFFLGGAAIYIKTCTFF